jgi:hypothetical protein
VSTLQSAKMKTSGAGPRRDDKTERQGAAAGVQGEKTIRRRDFSKSGGIGELTPSCLGEDECRHDLILCGAKMGAPRPFLTFPK